MKYVSQKEKPNTSQRSKGYDNTKPPTTYRNTVETSPNRREVKSVPRDAPRTRSANSNRQPIRQAPIEQDSRSRRMSNTVVRQQKRRKKNYTLYYILLFIIVATTVITLSLTVFFKIDSIEVSGAVGITEQQIIETAQIEMDTNLIMAPTSNMENAVKKAFVTIEDVQVKRSFPSKLSVNVTMAVPIAVFLYNQHCYTVSEQYRILNIGDIPLIEDLPIIVGVDLEGIKEGDTLSDRKKYHLDETEATFEAIAENELTGVSYVDLNNPLEISIYIGDSYEIQVGGRTELNYKLHCAKTILETKISEDEKGIINVSVDNGMYSFRPVERIVPPLPDIIIEP